MDIEEIKKNLINIRERMHTYEKVEQILTDSDFDMYYNLFKNDSSYLTSINKIFNFKEIDIVNEIIKNYIKNIKRKLTLKKL